MICRALIALLSLALCGTDAFAWSGDGHRITAYVALELLSSSARSELRELLGNEDLAAISTLLDDERESFENKYRGSARWHYENRATCGSGVSCPNRQCVTAQLERFISILKNRQQPRIQRIEALEVVVHLVGDLHQPLHMSDNADRGGNDVWVQLPRERQPRRLHEVWDYSFVRLEMNRRSAAAYARTLAASLDRRDTKLSTSSIETWAAETHNMGKRYGYEALPQFACHAPRPNAATPIVLDAEYVRDARAIVREQLTKGGARLAHVLNDALGR